MLARWLALLEVPLFAWLGLAPGLTKVFDCAVFISAVVLVFTGFPRIGLSGPSPPSPSATVVSSEVLCCAMALMD